MQQTTSLPRPSFVSLVLCDSSTWVLLASNIITIAWAYGAGWTLADVIWIYWFQSVIIGISNVVHILSLKKFTTTNLKMNNRPVPQTEAAKRQVAGFFAMHYGFFHLAYLVFLWKEAGGSGSATSWFGTFFCIASFAASHTYSLFYNRRREQAVENLGNLMFFPYIRILPIHLIIVGGAFLSSTATVYFLMLKTAADILSHVIEHKIRRGPAAVAF